MGSSMNPKFFVVVFLALITVLLFGAGIYYANTSVQWGWFIFGGLIPMGAMVALVDDRILKLFD